MTLMEIGLCSTASFLILFSVVICCNKNKCVTNNNTQPMLVIVDAPKYEAYPPPSYVHAPSYVHVPSYEDPTTINK